MEVFIRANPNSGIYDETKTIGSYFVTIRKTTTTELIIHAKQYN